MAYHLCIALNQAAFETQPGTGLTAGGCPSRNLCRASAVGLRAGQVCAHAPHPEAVGAHSIARPVRLPGAAHRALAGQRGE